MEKNTGVPKIAHLTKRSSYLLWSFRSENESRVNIVSGKSFFDDEHKIFEEKLMFAAILGMV